MRNLILWSQYFFSGIFFGTIGHGGRYGNDLGALGGFFFGLTIMRLIEIASIYYKLQAQRQIDENLTRMFQPQD